MKQMKRIASLLLVTALLLTLSVGAFAATVTVDGMTGHSFVAYQIFTGSQSTSEGALGDIEWGTGINSAAFLTDLQADDTFKVEDTNVFANCTTAMDVAAAMAQFTDDSEAAKKIANLADKNRIDAQKITLTNGANTLADGYYLIVDVTEINGEANDARNPALLEVTRDITIATKYTVPGVTKKVQDKDDTEGTTSGWQDSADYDIGDEIEFQLTGTLPSNYSDYESYKYIFHDTMSHMTYKDGSVKVMVGENDITSSFATTWDATGKKLTISCSNLKTISGLTKDSQIVVTYIATLDADAVIGQAGNDNKVKVEYSNDPNKDGTGNTGKTPEDVVTVFTYKLTVDKVDDQNTALSGAGFTLYKWVKNGVAVPPTEEGGETTYEDGWIAVGNEITGVTTFEFKGLDAGKYKLVETTTPAGYNTAADIEFTITATHSAENADPTLDTLSVDNNNITVTLSTGTLDTDVVNRAGSVLPETGGMGTTIFYTVGAILVLAAVVLLVTKRRMNVAE